MKMRYLYTALLLALSCFAAKAQMWNGTDTLYGNEWIRYDRPYFKIATAEDGVLRIPYETLAAQGIPADATFRLYAMGREVPLYFSNPSGTLAAGDYVEFFGKKNRAEIDRHLYKNPDTELFNPEFSLITDTAFYFLTWDISGPQTPLRYQNTPNIINDLPAPEPWFWHEEKIVNSAGSQKRELSDGSLESAFQEGEGYGSGMANSQTINMLPKFNFAGAGVDAQFDLRIFSSNHPHQLRIAINDAEAFAQDFNGYRLVNPIISKAASALTAMEKIVLTGAASANDRYSVSVARLRHPRAFNFDNKTVFAFTIQGNGGEQYLEIENFDAGAVAPILYDLSNRLRLEGIIESGKIKFKLPAATGARDLFLANAASGYRTVTSLLPVTFTDYLNTDAQFIIISNKRLYNDGSGGNPIEEYAQYRSTPEGGGYRTVVADVTTLYDQFAYGVQRHPLSIRNFAHFAKKTWSDPRYVLLIGKGRTYENVRTPTQLANANNNSFFVPTFGRLGSDNLLLADNFTMVPVMAVGRIPAETPTEVRLYLDKVRDHEMPFSQSSAEDRLWHKQIVHLGGGGFVPEQNIIRNHLANMAAVLEQSDFGAKTFAFHKTSPDPIQYSQSEVITNRINAGASIVTFFGHSDANNFDFSLDDPANYRNENRYPLMIALGCYTGAIHRSSKTIGEKFVFQTDKGALAFLAAINLGQISALYNYTKEFYTELGNDNYGKGIGDALRATTVHFDNTGTFMRPVVQQMTLNGDPALVISPATKPDFFIPGSSVKFTPEIVDTQMDSLEFRFDVFNAGRASADSLDVLVNRILPNGSEVETARLKVPAPRYESSLTLRAPVLGKLGAGANRFYVTLDPDNAIDEMPLPDAEQNNELIGASGEPGAPLYIFDNGVSPVYPPDFSIVNQQPVQLYASTSDAFAPERSYLMELDTTKLFNSPQLKRTTLRQKGGLLQWAPEALWQDSTVYYWRVSPDTTTNFGYIWRNASFLYVGDSPNGWNQSHHFQFKENDFFDMEISDTTRQFKFLDDVKTIEIKNGVYPGITPLLAINNTPYQYLAAEGPFVNGGLNISVFDPVTIRAWQNDDPGFYGSQLGAPWANEWATFPFSTQTQARRESVINFLRDTVPSGHYVLIYSVQNGSNHYQPEQWAADSLVFGTNIFRLLEQQGATLIRQTATTGPQPYLIFYKKDDPGFPVFEQMVPNGEVIRKTFLLEGFWDEGAVRSKLAGPAQQWSSLHWKVAETNIEDRYSLDVYGVRADSSQLLLLDDFAVQDTTIDWINAAEFPYLRLQLNAADTFLRTAPQLRHWRVLYEGLPEAALDPVAYFRFQRDTVQQGEPVSVQIAARNLSEYNMDSLLVRYVLTDEANNLLSRSFRMRPLPGKDTLVVSLNIDTRNLSGRQKLTLEINPDNDQPELSHLNNFGFYDFFVERDKRNPLVEVTFDGTPIMDGDLVSAKPFIAISLRDENPFLALADTSVLKLLLRYPDATDVTEIPFSDPRVRFIPADASDLTRQNRASVEFTPHFLQSGTYELTVQGRDVTGNASGNLDYRVSFEVETAAKISNVFNYPNPFSTSTQFVYTLTGEEPPAQLTIRIMTVSGRVVREISQAELGPLRIGTHRTDFVWDGTDTYGDRLANGVYLYQVFAKDAQGKDYEKYENGTDGYFKKGIGKLVILR
ncbi:MAG: C25 family cysteine peptidase [Saprospiraceae bacterium]